MSENWLWGGDRTPNLRKTVGFRRLGCPLYAEAVPGAGGREANRLAADKESRGEALRLFRRGGTKTVKSVHSQEGDQNDASIASMYGHRRQPAGCHRELEPLCRDRRNVPAELQSDDSTSAAVSGALSESAEAALRAVKHRERSSRSKPPKAEPNLPEDPPDPCCVDLWCRPAQRADIDSRLDRNTAGDHGSQLGMGRIRGVPGQLSMGELRIRQL